MSNQKAPPLLAFPVEEIRKLLLEVQTAKSMAASYIKFYAPDVELINWDNSQMPTLTDVFSYSHQMVEFLTAKLTILEEMEEPIEAVPFAPEEVMMLTGVIKAIEKSKMTLKLKFNVSFEVH